MQDLDALAQENAPKPGKRATQGVHVAVADDQAGQVVDAQGARAKVADAPPEGTVGMGDHDHLGKFDVMKWWDRKKRKIRIWPIFCKTNVIKSEENPKVVSRSNPRMSRARLTASWCQATI